MTDVSAGVAASLAVFDEQDEAQQTKNGKPQNGLEVDFDVPDSMGAFCGGDIPPSSYKADEPEDEKNDHAAELSDTGVTIFNYSMRDRMDGDGGDANKMGYRNFAPVMNGEVDPEEKRRKEADEHLFLILEHYEAQQRLAEIEARLRALEVEIKDLTNKIDAMNAAFEMGDDADINDDTLNGLAKRNEMRRNIKNAGLDPDEYFKADGKFDQEKWMRDQERNRAIQAGYEERLQRAVKEQRDLSREKQQIIESGKYTRAVEASASGNPDAQREIAAVSATRDGAVDVAYTVLNNSSNLSAQEKASVLTQVGPEGRTIQADVATSLANNVGNFDSLQDRLSALDDLSSLGSGSVPSPVPTRVAASPLPETLPELVAPLRSVLPPGLPVPDIRLIDTIPKGMSVSDAGGPRSMGSAAAEFGLDDGSAGKITPISATFAQAAGGQSPLAAIEAESALVTEQRRTIGATAQAGMPMGGMA